MKKFFTIVVLGIIVCSFSSFAQLKVASNGYVGISTTTPAYRLDIYSGESRIWYPNSEPFGINHWGSDPRLTSSNAIVFYKPDGSGFIDVQCRTLYQYSDMNAKENITQLGDEKSLESGKNIGKISQLKGVNYTWKDDKDKKLQVGFLAQDVEKVIPEAVIKADSSKVETMSYTAIIPYLVEAIKEQQAQIETLKNMVENCCNSNLKSASLSIEPSSEIIQSKAQLDQNVPNPFNSETKIGCFIPDKSNSSTLYIYNMQGTQLQQYALTGKGTQVVTIHGNIFAPGIYLYSLVIDGKEIDTKRMILTN